MKKRMLATLALSFSLLAACNSGPAPSPQPTTPTDFSKLKTLNPGKQDTIRTQLKVNIVFVGYRQTLPGQVATARQVNTADFNEILPKTYESIARIPSAYGRTEPTGNAFDYQYNYVFADQNFEDSFFGYLKAQGKDAPLTFQQKLYNCQNDVDPETGAPTCETPAGNINRVIDGNLQIDARVTENWLADNVARVGVNPGEYTIFMVNWFDRPDFKYHSYTRLDAVDSDADQANPAPASVFGQRGSRRLIAWGGSVRDNAPAQRVWFYDLSANPDPWTNAYDVTNPDVDGDREPDYRMPPIWEYGTRKASIGYGRKVSPDLALVTRYAALNLLFTPSPIYRAALTPPQMPEEIELNVHVEQGSGAVAQGKVYQPDLAQRRVSVLQPFAKFTSTVKETPLSGDLSDVYQCFFADPSIPADICSPDYADATGERLFTFAVDELRREYANTPANKYLLPIYLFNDQANTQPGLLGIAYDDGETGTQSFVYSFLTPGLNAAGYGFTDTSVHEVGHHLSLSHPHDGYDSEKDISYGPSGQFLFVNVGDESATIMSYNDLSRDFGQFNLDSQYRYLTAAYLNNTNAILELSRRSSQEGKVAVAATAADTLFAQAKAKYDALAYLDAARLAHQGYREVLDAAKTAGVDVQAYKWYQNLNGLSAGKAKPTFSRTFQAQKGVVIFPEENAFQRSKRLAP
ncbi:hypothetical protein [Deinococcus aerophilus]|uniref:Peptidase M43 pregnancy-associated plasma-A domain-containing protein n=1 Tax=Deinococcus aerophilus TaxID=522488 RepID=A0ABQ2GV68_9DEIO|nr:hypothetical protein [Deinococcus aerophilus]GGM15075.1 hypothetical protein GCM10010841_24490 [Deinococcus aerophilus]